MKKYIAALVLTALVAFPSVVSAVWWNPFTWFKKAAPVTPIEVVSDTIPTEVVSPPKQTLPTETLTTSAFDKEMSTAISAALKQYGDKGTLQSFTSTIAEGTLSIKASVQARSVVWGNPRAGAQLRVKNGNQFELVNPIEIDANAVVGAMVKQYTPELSNKIIYVLEYNRPGKKITRIELTQQGTMILTLQSIPKQGGTSDTKALAQCIKKSGAKFYGASWCPHCQATKALFGTAAGELPYVECSTPDNKGQIKACTDAGITGYPTWKFKDGSELIGQQTLQVLAQKTGCRL